jgi:hypothetical protein
VVESCAGSGGGGTTTESDPIAIPRVAAIEASTANWNTAYSWGNSYLVAPATFTILTGQYLVSPATFTIGGSGDNLGNHIATEVLEMGSFAVNTSSSITAGKYQINGLDYLVNAPSSQPNGSIAIGWKAAKSLTSNLDGNIYIGREAGQNELYGGENTVVGAYASSNGGTNTQANTVMGYLAGYQIGNNSNTCIGDRACFLAGDIYGNVAIGRSAGGATLSTGDENILIGINVDVPSGSDSKYLNIGGAIYGFMTAGSTITFNGSISAESYIDRTPYPDTLQSAYDEIASITREENNPRQVDHSKLHPRLKAKGKLSKIDRYENRAVTYTEKEKGVMVEKTKTESVPVYKEELVEGRDLSETVSALVEVVKDLNARIKVLEPKVK